MDVKNYKQKTYNFKRSNGCVVQFRTFVYDDAFINRRKCVYMCDNCTYALNIKSLPEFQRAIKNYLFNSWCQRHQSKAHRATFHLKYALYKSCKLLLLLNIIRYLIILIQNWTYCIPTLKDTNPFIICSHTRTCRWMPRYAYRPISSTEVGILIWAIIIFFLKYLEMGFSGILSNEQFST